MRPLTFTLLTLLATTSLLSAQIKHGTIEVTQTSTSTNAPPATMEFTPGSSNAFEISINTPFNRGDYGLGLAGFDASDGVLLTSPAEHTRIQPGESEFQATTSADITTSNSYSIALHKTPDGSEGNLNASFAWFPYGIFYGAHTIGPDNGETMSLNSSFLSLGTAPGANIHVIDDPTTDGIFTVDLTDFGRSSANGILLTNGGENEDNFAISEANSDGTFTVYCHDNGTDGQTYEQDRISFVYLQPSEIGTGGLTALGRVNSDASLDVSSDNFTVTKGGTGEWFLTIPAHSPSSGTLIVTPAAEANAGFGYDNFVTSQWDPANQRWSIKSWDLKGSGTPAAPQDSASGGEALFNFAFIASNVIDEASENSLNSSFFNSRDGATLTFDPSLSGETISFSFDPLIFDKDLNIDASNLPLGLTIEADQNDRAIEINSGHTVTLDSLTITGGDLAGSSGGILNNGDLTLQNCTLSNNTATSGGGILNNGNLTLLNCTFSDNTATTGGGLANLDPATCIIDSCTFSQNTATGRGGAIFAQGTVTLNNTTISENTAGTSGGGLLVESIIILGGDGTADLTLQNTLIANNTAPADPDITRSSGGGLPNLTLQGINLIGDNTGSGVSASPGLIGTSADPVDPLLAPLSHYGGPTQTMHPCANSPALIPSPTTTRTDQRGFTLTGLPTIGSIKVPSSTQVTNEATLRAELANAPSSKGKVITFASALDGQTLTLTGGQLLIPSLTNGLFIDASTLPNGLTIDANGQVTNHRVLEIQPNSTSALHSLSLTGGKAANGSNGGKGEDGGGILVDSNSHLTLTACTVSSNQTGNGGNSSSNSDGGNGGDGGGISVSPNSSLTLTACTVSNNRTGNGGNSGVFSKAGDSGLGGGILVSTNTNLTLTACTISNNQTGNGGKSEDELENGSGGDGGGILYLGSKMDILHCTIVDNVASDSGSGGGISYINPRVTLTTSIVANNYGKFGSDIYQRFSSAGDVITGAESYVGDLSGWAYTSAPTTGGNINLSPLGHYGGPTQTMIPLPGSPAIDAATTSTVTTDQRGFSRPLDGDNNGTAIPDIGATEAPNWANLSPFDIAWLFQTDIDGDGNPWGLETALGSDPDTPDTLNDLNIPAFDFNGDAVFQFGRNITDAPPGVTLRLKRSLNLSPGSFQELFSITYGDPSDSHILTDPNDGLFLLPSNPNITFTDTDSPTPKAFYRLEADYTPPAP
ncbi:MAG: choice-of-anchor Q domain-containing protein [Verrucomicrobiota bacterium]